MSLTSLRSQLIASSPCTPWVSFKMWCILGFFSKFILSLFLTFRVFYSIAICTTSDLRHLNVEWPSSSIWLPYIMMWTFNMTSIYVNIIVHFVALHNTLLENDHAFYKSSWIWWHLKNSNVSTHVLMFSHFTLYD